VKFLSIVICLLSLNVVFANESSQKITFIKIYKSLHDLQASNWTLNDLVKAQDISCKTKDAQDMFDLAHKNLGESVIRLKNNLKSGGAIDSSILYAISRSINDSYMTFKSLIFLNEIVIKKQYADRKFEDSRFRQMKSIMFLREYVQNGDYDIYNPLNQKASAMAFIMQRVPDVYKTELINSLPSFVSQSDLKFVKVTLDKVAHGSMMRYFNSYFRDHLNSAFQDNFKGELATQIINKVGGWTLNSLETLPQLVTEDVLKLATKIITATPNHLVAKELKNLFSTL